MKWNNIFILEYQTVECMRCYQEEFSKLDGKDYAANIKTLSKSLYYSRTQNVGFCAGPLHFLSVKGYVIV